VADSAAFLAMLPAFGTPDVPVETIDAYLANAERFVTEDYGADQDAAQIYLAAHNMSMAGIGPEKSAAALIGVASISSGSLSFTVDKKMGMYGYSSYGRIFYSQFLVVYRGTIFVTGTGTVPEDLQTFLHGSDAD
jgi:hypothetical protein